VSTGLAELPADASVILVHDAARPLVSDDVVERVLAPLAEGWDGAVPGLPLTDTVKRVRGGEVVETLERGELVAVQTPQAFEAGVLQEAFRGDIGAAVDCSSLVEAVGGDQAAAIAYFRKLNEIAVGDDRPELVTALQKMTTATTAAAKTMANDRNLTMLKGLYAAHKEIQLVIKDANKNPWNDVRVRQAMNHAINRQDIIDKVFGGDAVFSSIIPPGYGDWPLAEADLKNNYLKYDVEAAKALMQDAGLPNGFEMELQSIASPRYITQAAEVVAEHFKAIGIKANVVPLEIGTFAKNNGDGTFPGGQLTARGMRGDPNGYVTEFNPKTPTFEGFAGAPPVVPIPTTPAPAVLPSGLRLSPSTPVPAPSPTTPVPAGPELNPRTPVAPGLWPTTPMWSPTAKTPVERGTPEISEVVLCATTPTASETLIDGYRQHLERVRGLAVSTIWRHADLARDFLRFLGYDDDLQRLARIQVVDLERFIAEVSARVGRITMQKVIAIMRSFLRFLSVSGRAPAGLDQWLESPRYHRDQHLVRALPWDKVLSVLRVIDLSTLKGRRDYAMLLLIATYGLRRGEVASLTLDDIQWRAGVIRVPRPKVGIPLAVPLTDEVATGLLAYLHDRAAESETRQLFLRVRAPQGPILPSAIGDVFDFWAARAGVRMPGLGGPHALRHGVAMNLLRRGTSLKAIGDLLGHRNVESTGIYLRLQIDDLRDVALPLPTRACPEVRP